MAFPTDWLYRKSITLSRASGAVTNYQMKLLVGESSGAAGEAVDCGGLCKTDFSDLRFTASDGVTLLDYWIEEVSGTTPNQLATIWVEFNSIGTGATTFYMYYGNAAATAVSSGANTFIGFYDFASALDTGVWTVRAGSTSVTGTVLRVIGNTGRIETKTAFNAGTLYRSRVKIADNTHYASFGYYAGWGNEYRADFYANNTTANVLNTCSATPAGSYQWTNIGDIGAGDAFHIYEIKRNAATNVLFDVDGVNKSTHATKVPSGPIVLHINTEGQDVYCDWIFISQWLAAEPAWGAWGGQESLGGVIVPVLLSQYRRRWAA